MNRCTTSIIFLLFFAFTSLAVPTGAFAQVFPDDEDIITDTGDEENISDTTSEGLPDDKFTGTLSTEDPKGPNYIDPDKFGSNEAGPEDDEDEEFANMATHKLLIKSEFEVLTTDLITADPYISVTYTVDMETLIQVKNKRYRKKIFIDIYTDIIGKLFMNELLECNLSIEIEPAEIELLVFHDNKEETYDEDASSTLAIQLKFIKKVLEDWFSKCLAGDGSKLDTRGAPENNFQMAYNALLPSPMGLTFEDYDIDDTAVIETEVEPFIIEGDIEEQLITGAMTVTVEPLPEPVDFSEEESTNDTSEGTTEETLEEPFDESKP